MALCTSLVLRVHSSDALTTVPFPIVCVCVCVGCRYGFNMVVALAMESLLQFIVGKHVLDLHIVSQFVVYGCYFGCLGIIFVAVALRKCMCGPRWRPRHRAQTPTFTALAPEDDLVSVTSTGRVAARRSAERASGEGVSAAALWGDSTGSRSRRADGGTTSFIEQVAALPMSSSVHGQMFAASAPQSLA